MNRANKFVLITTLIAFNTVVGAGLARTGPPLLLSPTNGSATGEVHPQFRWTLDGFESMKASTSRVYYTRIAQVAGGLVATDSLPAVVQRWIPAIELPLGELTWAIGVGGAQSSKVIWSDAFYVTIVPPVQTFRISENATLREIRAVVSDAVNASSG